MIQLYHFINDYSIFGIEPKHDNMKRFIEQFCILLLVACFTSASAQNEDRGCNLTVVVDSTHASAPQAQDGSVNAIATGGTAPYTYMWYTGETSQSRNNLGTGRYCVTVTDANGCTGSDCSRVSAPGCESLGIGIGMRDFGTSDSNTVFTWADGGTTPYNYSWSNGATTDTVYNVPDGSYCVTITDANTCSMTACVGNVNTVGIHETALNEVQVYPNPVRDVLHIELPDTKDAVMQLLSIEGKILLTQSLMKGNNNIPTNNLAKGLYICRISSGHRSNNTKILIE